MCAGGGGGGGVTIPTPNTEQDLTKVDLQEQAEEGLESISDAETATQDALDETGIDLSGGHSANPDLDLVKEVQEGVESAKDFMEGTQDIVHVVQEGVNPIKILQNPKKELIDDPLQRYEDWKTKTKEDWKETKEKFDAQNQESADDFSKMLQNLGGTMTDVITGASTSATNMVNLAHDDLVQALVAAGLITMNDDDDGPGNAQAILEGDPRMLSLLTRRRQARKRGKAQLRKGGGLYIPLKTGIQVPVA